MQKKKKNKNLALRQLMKKVKGGGGVITQTRFQF